MLTGLADAPLTYREAGATVATALPAGYRHDRASVDVGEGEQAWTRAQDAIRRWEAHRHVGATLTPSEPPLVPETTVISTLKLGPLFVLAPCRIIYVTTEEDRFGFAYGTLPGHPERGEEAFHVVRADDGRVRFEITVFSRPADLFAQMGKPVANLLQRRVTRRYLEGVRGFVGSRTTR